MSVEEFKKRLADDAMMTFFKSFDDEVEGKSARGIATAGGSGLDHQLKDLLRSNLLYTTKDDKLFGVKDPLHEFSAKCRMAHALGLISDNEKRELEFLGKIRNELAHVIGSGSFDVDPVRSWCMELKLCEVLYAPSTVPVPQGVGTVYPHGYDEDGYPLLSEEDLFLQNPRDAKSRFIASITVMMTVLAVRIFNTADTKIESPNEFTSSSDMREPLFSALEDQLHKYEERKQQYLDLKAEKSKLKQRLADAGIQEIETKDIDTSDIDASFAEQDESHQVFVSLVKISRIADETVRRARARHADQTNHA